MARTRRWHNIDWTDWMLHHRAEMADLTPREQSLIRLRADGLTWVAVGRALHCAPSTAFALMRRLEVSLDLVPGADDAQTLLAHIRCPRCHRRYMHRRERHAPMPRARWDRLCRDCFDIEIQLGCLEGGDHGRNARVSV